MKKICTVGESMALFIAAEVSRFSAVVAGAELNVAIGLARLGHPVTYHTRLGRDAFGERIRLRMEQEGLSQAGIAWDDTRPTGFMLKGKVSRGDPPTAYFRRGSAASAFGPADAEAIDLSGCAILHLTGIFPALSATARCRTCCAAVGAGLRRKAGSPTAIGRASKPDRTRAGTGGMPT